MRKVAIYGAAVFGEIFCDIMGKHNISVDFFIDEFILMREVLGKPVYRIKEVQDKEVEIYISATTHTKQIESDLKSRGFNNIINFVDTFVKFPKALTECLKKSGTWYSKIENMIETDKLNEVKDLLSDDFSRDLLDKIINFRKNTVPQNYIMPQNSEKQYFPDDIELFSNIKRLKFIDGGAFTGDTIPFAINALRKLNKDVEYIISFEPDATNIQKLNKEQIRQNDKFPSIKFFTYNSALWSENTILSFSSNLDSASCISSQDKNSIQIAAINLDSALFAATPNYIKMDIEGAEYAAVTGAKEIIKQHTPILAICVYHKPSDLWKIPLLINSINSNYKMYLRLYGHLGLETVLYCVPK